MPQVTFDDRERSLFDAFCRYTEARRPGEFVATCERLAMGDILIRAGADDARDLCIAVERKTLPDLMASAFDGRLAEQTQRLHGWQGDGGTCSRWCVLLIEGVTTDPARFFGGVERWRFLVKKCLLLALQEHRPADRRLVLRTANELESAALLATLYKTGEHTAYMCAPEGTILATTDETGCQVAASLALLPRKHQGDAFATQLCCTRGVSLHRAERIRERGFKTMSDLCTAAADRPGEVWACIQEAVGGRAVAARLWQDLGIGPTPPPPQRKKKKVP